MPLYRHPESPYWWVRFSVGGVKVRRSSGTADKQAAEEFETRIRADLWRQRKLGERPRYTWREAVDHWYSETSGRGRERDKERLAWFSKELETLPLDAITPAIIEKLRALRAGESSQATANRYMALLRMILRKAQHDWDWIDKAPTVPMYRLERTEPRYLTRAQFARLKAKLPPHLQAIAEFSVETGLRMRNVTHLTWEQVDLKRRLLIVPAARAKAGETLAVPLSIRAAAIVREQLAAQRKRAKDKGEPLPSRVFIFRGRSIDDANGAAFKKAAAAAGVPWLRWHDLRHTWASWHIQAGTPPHILQELGGWQSYEMVKRYAHLSTDHLRAFVEHGKGTVRRSSVSRGA